MGNLGGADEETSKEDETVIEDETVEALSAGDIERLLDNPVRLLSGMLPVPLPDPLLPTAKATSNGPDMLAFPSLFDKLLALLALLFCVFPLPVPAPPELLASPLPPPLKGVSRSNPYCSKDRLNDVPVSLGSGIWSWGGRPEDMMVKDKDRGLMCHLVDFAPVGTKVLSSFACTAANTSYFSSCIITIRGHYIETDSKCLFT